MYAHDHITVLLLLFLLYQPFLPGVIGLEGHTITQHNNHDVARQQIACKNGPNNGIQLLNLLNAATNKKGRTRLLKLEAFAGTNQTKLRFTDLSFKAAAAGGGGGLALSRLTPRKNSEPKNKKKRTNSRQNWPRVAALFRLAGGCRARLHGVGAGGGEGGERLGAGEEGRQGVAGHDDDDPGRLPVERHEHPPHRRRLLLAAGPAPRGGQAARADEREQRHHDEAHHEREAQEEVRRRRPPQARPRAAARHQLCRDTASAPLRPHHSPSLSLSLYSLLLRPTAEKRRLAGCDWEVAVGGRRSTGRMGYI
jgi:hypothetical protein